MLLLFFSKKRKLGQNELKRPECSSCCGSSGGARAGGLHHLRSLRPEDVGMSLELHLLQTYSLETRRRPQNWRLHCKTAAVVPPSPVIHEATDLLVELLASLFHQCGGSIPSRRSVTEGVEEGGWRGGGGEATRTRDLLVSQISGGKQMLKEGNLSLLVAHTLHHFENSSQRKRP